MVSFCIKSLNKKIIDELELHFNNLKMQDIFYSQKKFSKFYNFIFHYTGNNLDDFYSTISKMMAKFIVDNYEKNFILSVLKYDFFYFSDDEKISILNNMDDLLSSKKMLSERLIILENCIYEFHKTTRKYNIDGFINFRIGLYKEFLNTALEQAIHKYVLDKEYSEYVDLLKEYIHTQNSQTSKMHLIYTSDDALLLDEFGNIVTTTASKKYLSDISFSKNDFILNSILSFIPGSLIVHSFNQEDSFIHFLKLIFDNKLIICDNCDLCKSFSAISIKK